MQIPVCQVELEFEFLGRLCALISQGKISFNSSFVPWLRSVKPSTRFNKSFSDIEAVTADVLPID